MAAKPVPYYWNALDFAALTREFPPPPMFEATMRLSADELHALQNRRFLQQVERGWQVPFYRLHWGAVGLQPGDIRSLEDITKLPPYTVHDIRRSIERHPPFGDYMGIELGDHPLVLQTSGGTTGLPRPMLYTPQDREVMSIIGGRRFHMQGIRPGDVVQITYSLGLGNGASAPREALWKYSGAVPVTTGSGSQTPTRRQIELLKAWGVSAILGFPAYLRHMGELARDELGIDPRDLGLRSIGSHLGMDDRKPLEDLWGAPVFESYGSNESGIIAAEGPGRDGMTVFEDAYFVEIVDPETNREVAAGERGNAFITCLFKFAAPVIRFNSNDVSAFATDRSPIGWTHRRLQRIFGRADNMIKLRGVNVFPEAVGALVAEDPRSNGEYICIVERVDAAGRDEMLVKVERSDPAVEAAALARDLEVRFREALGVKIAAEVVNRGDLDPLTGLTQTSKIRRLLDRRKA